jgi:hypothetical protein
MRNKNFLFASLKWMADKASKESRVPGHLNLKKRDGRLVDRSRRWVNLNIESYIG